MKTQIKTHIVALILILFCMVTQAYPQVVTTAGLELVNTFQKLNIFQAGIQLNGATTGSIQLLASDTTATYALKFPRVVPTPNSFLQVGPDGSTLGFTPSCSGFQAAGDLTGNGTSQSVVGLNNTPIDTSVTPTNGMSLKFVSATGKWTPQ